MQPHGVSCRGYGVAIIGVIDWWFRWWATMSHWSINRSIILQRWLFLDLRDDDTNNRGKVIKFLKLTISRGRIGIRISSCSRALLFLQFRRTSKSTHKWRIARTSSFSSPKRPQTTSMAKKFANWKFLRVSQVLRHLSWKRSLRRRITNALAFASTKPYHFKRNNKLPLM